MDFIPLIITLISVLIGIVGNTWNNEQSGIKKLTATGWVIACLAIASFCYASFILHGKNKQISQIQEIRKIAHLQIFTGIDFMTRHLRLGDENLQKRLELMTDSNHQDEIGKRRLIHFTRLEGGVVSDGVDGQMGKFEETYKLYDANIKHGKHLLDDAIIKYSQYLQPTTVISVSEVLRHKNKIKSPKF